MSDIIHQTQRTDLAEEANTIRAKTRPINRHEQLLEEKFSEHVANQSGQMDKLAQHLITLELAVPGLYVAVLEFTQGDELSLAMTNWLFAIFALWLVALLLTLASLIPRRWRVDTSLLTQSTGDTSGVVGIEDFFRMSAAYKRRLLISASLLFWAGIACALFVAFSPGL